MPRINRQIGYGYLCKKVTDVSAKYGISDIRTWKMSRAECTDVYLNMPVRVMPQDSVPKAAHGRGYILMTRKSCLPLLHDAEEATVVDNYAIITFKEHR